MKFPFLLLFILFSSITYAQEAPKTIHIMVALCDNTYQGIVRVPEAIGNGQDANSNLYWGAMYGVRTYFKKSATWNLIATQHTKDQTDNHILERCIFKHKSKNIYLIADAYDGQYIQETTTDFIYASGGHRAENATHEELSLPIKGGADLVAYVGHNGLMDFVWLDGCITPLNCEQKEVMMLGCITKSYFSEILACTNANPLLWTTNLMAPEAYTLEAAIDGWVKRDTGNQIRERAAAAYHKYQKCGLRGARGLLVTGF